MGVDTPLPTKEACAPYVVGAHTPMNSMGVSAPMMHGQEYSLKCL